MGPYSMVTAEKYYGSGKTANLNGETINESTPPINFGKHFKSQLAAMTSKYIDSATGYGIWPAIDVSPFITSSGDMYLYFSQHVSSITDGNRIWGMKMKDMITPDFSTLTLLLMPSEQAKNKQVHQFTGTKGDINYNNWTGTSASGANDGGICEGAFAIEHDGKYYLTYSPFGYGDRRYSVMQTVGDTPLGPFRKLSRDYANPVIGIGTEQPMYDFMSGTGHHSFVKAGGELFAVYHAFYNPVNNQPNGSFLGRAIGADRVQFMHNDTLGYDILYGNGPTYSLQPLPDVATGKTNVARKATIVTDGDKDTEKYLNDGLFTVQDFTLPWEYNATNAEQKGTTITLKWDKPVTSSSFIVYNSQSYFYAFDKVDSVVFKLAEKPSWYGDREYNGYCYMKDVACDPDHVDNDNWFMRQGGGALASFNEITVTEMTIRISSKYTTMSEDLFDEDNYAIHVSDIYVTGKEA